MSTRTPPSTCRFRYAFGCVVLIAASLALSRDSSAQSASARHRLIVGQHVTVKPIENRHPITARVIQLPAEAESDLTQVSSRPTVKVRARIESIDRSNSQLRVLGRFVIVDGGTRAPSTISGIQDLSRGLWVKLEIDTTESGQLHAHRIETRNIERRTKIDGVINSVWQDSVSIGGFVIIVPTNVRIDYGTLTASERLFAELINAQDPKQPAPWFSRNWLWSRGKVGINQRIENDFSIGDSAADHYREAEPVLKLELTARGPSGVSAFLKLRSRNTFVWENAPLRKRPHESAIDLYEGYVLWRDVLSLPIAFQIGRQDFDEYREWIFDAQLDAVRMYAYPLYPITVEVAYINSLDDSRSNKFRTLSDFLIHAHGRLSSSTEVGAYRLWRTDEDVRGQEPVWTGVRYRGTYFGVKPWAEAAWLRDWDKGRQFDAHAYDLGVTLTKAVASRRVSVTASTARASGNDNDPKATGVDRQFRQTGYEDNTGSYGGVTSLQYYGEVFDPELANLNIATVGCGLVLSPQASIDVVYHRFHQSEYSDNVARDLEGTDLTLYDYGGRGIDPDNGRPVKELFPYKRVGWELDVIVGLARIFGAVDIKWVTGFFVPQDALSPPFWEQLPFRPRKRTAYLNQLSLEYQF